VLAPRGHVRRDLPHAGPASFGLVLGTRRFALQVGGDTARDILAESKTFGSAEGLRIGFLTQVAEVPDGPR
jgi:enoyl-CoA hydratase/carnithine racemase